jgi:TctA family transporter
LRHLTKEEQTRRSRDAMLTAIVKARGWIEDIRLGRIIPIVLVIGVLFEAGDMFQVGETLVRSLRLCAAATRLPRGADSARLRVGRHFEENFRLALLISYGDLGVFVTRPVSAMFVALSVLLIAGQIYFRLRRR